MRHYGDITKLSGYTVYMYTFTDGKIYIGMTKNSIERRRDNGYQHNKPLQNALRKDGWENVKVDILATGLSQKEACETEKAEIKNRNAIDPEIGYNISFGGKNTFEGLKHTEQHKENMSKKMTGRKFSESHKRNMAIAHEKLKTPVLCVNESNKVIKEYSSLQEAARAVNGYATNIKRACEDGNKHYKGYLWRLKGVV